LRYILYKRTDRQTDILIAVLMGTKYDDMVIKDTIVSYGVSLLLPCVIFGSFIHAMLACRAYAVCLSVTLVDCDHSVSKKMEIGT